MIALSQRHSCGQSGAKVTLASEVISGESSINQAPIMGGHAGGNEVATRFLLAPSIEKIIHLVEEAQEQKAPSQRFIDKFARRLEMGAALNP